MSENKSFLDRQPGFLQFLILIGLVLSCTLIFTYGSFVLVKPIFGVEGADTLLLKASSDPDAIKNDFNAINAFKFIQLFSSLGTFLIPAFVFALTKKIKGDYLKLTSPVTLLFVALAILITISSGPLVDLLQEWNQRLKLPASMKPLEDLIKAMEDTAAKVTALFLMMPKTSDFIFNLFVIGIIPAIAEEFFFRGVLQQLLREWFKNIHWAIWVGAIIFSAIHFEFYGFVPRVVLGALLGYLFYWSGSLWVPIIAHALNNGGQVILAYLHQNGSISYDIESDQPVPMYVTIIATALLAVLLYYGNKKKVKEPLPLLELTEPLPSEPTDSNQWQ